jgi:hypothetical protein
MKDDYRALSSIEDMNEQLTPKLVERMKELVLQAWRAGIPVLYQDERCDRGKPIFVAANYDGSEDLVWLNYEAKQRKIIKEKITPVGQSWHFRTFVKEFM